ncbi:hypothetical protein IBL26_23465 [Roseomonas aerophila]|uniref:Phage replisome organizer, putative, N-terminal region n=1 Tax=Teichococcus aerophilus TaxID=1224513 RepID=A0ABR7RUG2_9PROT|nr:hypothetical protein [Pseudoroseomonas aerophila]MBC9209816.1 hypothetical protein [Pseudoroseomonas aerophila]
MARVATTERLMVRTVSDPGFLDLPERVQFLWYRLLSYALGAHEKGRIRFSGLSGSVSAAVSRQVPMTETEVETALATLERLGWLERDEETQSLWMPGARAGAARAEAARINGSKGGKPRKGETREEARERREDLRRRQGHLMMGIPGGAAETHGTHHEPSEESSCAVPTTTSLQELSCSSTAREHDDVASLAVELAQLARLDARRFDLQPVQAWLEAGASAALLRQVVQRVASRGSYAPERVNGWGYFTQALREALSTTTAPVTRAPIVRPAGPSGRERGYARQYLDLLNDNRPGSEQERSRQESFMRNYAPAAWKLVQEALRQDAA